MPVKAPAREKRAAILIMVCAVVYLWAAGPLKAGTMKNMGPAVFPWLVGGLLLFCGLIYLIKAFRSAPPATEEPAGSAPPAGKSRGICWPILVVTAGTLIYPFILGRLKFLLATQLVVWAMLVAYRPRRWAIMFAVGAVMTVTAFVVFYRFLAVGLPSGPLEEALYRLVR